MHFTIVTYTFPPSKEIGGRRWAKFSQHLQKLGHKVTVISANNSGSEKRNDAEFSGIEVIELPKKYPEWLSGYTKTSFEKIKYFAYTKILSKLTRQNFYDRGFAWRNQLLQTLSVLHSKNPIQVLVVTGGPFSLLAYGAEFKSRNKSVKFIADLRDPWTWGNLYGIPTMTNFKKEYQNQLEKKVIATCDMLTYPTESMGDFLKSKYVEYSEKLCLLPHAYDPEKFGSVEINTERTGFVYGGTIYSGIEAYIKCIASIVNNNKSSKFTWNIYTSTNYPLISECFNNGTVRLHPLAAEEVLFKIIMKSAAYLAVFPETDKDLISTKFFEIVYSKTPILYIGAEGTVGKFIRENKLGVHILPENLEDELPKYLNGVVPFEPGYFDVTKYSFGKVTSEFVRQVAQLIV